MFGPQGPIKDAALAERRARTCLGCPWHDATVPWTDYFTVPVANQVRSVLSWLRGQKLETPADENLRTCAACDCPMRLKVWARIEHVTKHIPAAAKAKLWEQCWIREESGKGK